MTRAIQVFHTGELALQHRAGVPASYRDRVAHAIRHEMPQQHRDFFESLPVLFLGLLDARGQVWATPAVGEVGFLRSRDPGHLSVGARPQLGESLWLDVRPGAKVGVVGMELSSRRRNRMNGTIHAVNGEGFEIAVDLSFGNCPQYIQTRDLLWPANPPAPEATALADWDARSRALVARADTFFIASRAAEMSDNPTDGIDASHRGGRPGFLTINADSSLSFPDFSGNRFFNTLGNIEADGRVGLFIPDFSSGAGIFVTGLATVDWHPDRVSGFKGAERIVDVQPEEIWYCEHALPGPAPLVSSWPMLAETGVW
ncbi:pyridoxamine 5'-phosphate oxidase family protein [Tritonibacter scottomollicae]|uniref:pyridoxamine 5'-phosphate oxidase family protein n=1 Tax=Tritonibacter scottomollicae TaxID=483013 RepID=UPI003AA8BF45